jgi:hypothetical protein
MRYVHRELHPTVRGLVDQRIEIDADYINSGRGTDG